MSTDLEHRIRRLGLQPGWVDVLNGFGIYTLRDLQDNFCNQQVTDELNQQASGEEQGALANLFQQSGSESNDELENQMRDDNVAAALPNIVQKDDSEITDELKQHEQERDDKKEAVSNTGYEDDNGLTYALEEGVKNEVKSRSSIVEHNQSKVTGELEQRARDDEVQQLSNLSQQEICIYKTSNQNQDQSESRIMSVEGATKMSGSTPDTFNKDAKPSDDRHPTEQNKHLEFFESEQGKFLTRLGLNEYFPEKITLKTIRERSTDRLETLHDVPWYVIVKLFMLDYRGRDDMLPENIIDSKLENTGACEKDHPKDDFEDLFFESSDICRSSNASAPHPLDVIIAIFHCSSNIVRQILCEKLFLCKLSIPFLLPQISNSSPTFLLWSLRGIILSGENYEESIVNCPTGIVSFLRLGKVSQSKSKFMNEILNGQSHSTFFHRDCKNATMKQILSRGLVEIAWHLPSKVKEKHQLNGSTALINLHGDATECKTNFELVSNISNVVVVMVNIHELENADVIHRLHSITSSNAELVLLISKNPQVGLDNKKEAITNNLRMLEHENFSKQNIINNFASCGERNIKDLKEEAIAKINSSLRRKESKTTLNSFEKVVKSLNILVDESQPELAKGQDSAMILKRVIEKDDIAESKVKKLPLQGKVWQDWAKLEKERHRLLEMADTSPDHYIAGLHDKMKQLRRDQITFIKKPSFLFERFIKTLLDSTGGDDRITFLKWLKYYLDDISRQLLPQLKKLYNAKRNEMRDAQEHGQLLKELQDLEKKRADSSFGLEHFMREVGQFYEAVASLKEEVETDVKERAFELPQVMAELMLAGYPLEVMDGDVSHVPLSWVQAVLSKLKDLIGDKNIFVLSVLGIQSSGKSTLLNTMFGLQFDVGAGRCTRGVYAQLIPLCSGDQDRKYDYILVVDTEGLRAPELGHEKLQHDNEIATLVIGLGDVTLVNIKGENHAEMEDIFQIVIHALLKMKLVNKSIKLQPSCIFIHQNVGAFNAAEKMEAGQQKFLDILDEVTRVAGEEEGATHLRKFKDLIDFDIKNIWYFSDLWKGDPPMAPVNPGYSEKVNEVKKALLTSIMSSRASCLTISDLSLKINDVWKGLLSENFVFSFRNSLEVMACNSLDAKTSELSSSLKAYALSWFNDKQCDVMNCVEEIESIESRLAAELIKDFTLEYNKTQQLLVEFFNGHKSKEMLRQWKAKTLKSFETCFEEILDRTKTDLKNEVEIRNIQLSQKNDTDKYKTEIRTEARNAALQMRIVENLSDVEVESKFKEIWSNWMDKIKTDYKASRINVEGTVLAVLYEKFRTDIALLSNQLSDYTDTPIDILQDFPGIDKDKHLEFTFLQTVKSFLSWKDYIAPAVRQVELLLRKVEKYLEDLEGKNFRKEYADAIIQMVLEMVSDTNSAKEKFRFKKELSIYLAVYICQYSTPILSALHEKFMNKINPKTVFEENYQAYFSEFKNMCKKSSQEKMAADTIAIYLNKALNDTVKRRMPEILFRHSIEISRDEIDDVNSNSPELRTKAKFLNSVLGDIITKDSFDEYMEFIKNYKSCLMKWIQHYVKKYFASKDDNGKTVYVDKAFSEIDKLVNEVSVQIMAAKEKAEKEDNTADILSSWVKLFHDVIKTKLIIDRSDLLSASHSNIEDLSFFTKALESALKDIQKSLKDHFEKHLDTYLSSTEKDSVCKLIFDKCVGCPERCPYCRAPCSYTTINHPGDHSALEHFPQGVNGIHWKESKKLAIESCSVQIAENIQIRRPDVDDSGEETGFLGNIFNFFMGNPMYYPIRDYKKYYSDWMIESEASMEGPVYWKRFMAKFGLDLARKYGREPPNIPKGWNNITIDEVRNSLKKQI